MPSTAPTGQLAQSLTAHPNLYSVSLSGGQPVSLSAPLLPSDATDLIFDISPDGSRVIYMAYKESTSYHSLYTVPIQGGTNPKRLSISGHDVRQFAFTADSHWVVFSTWDSSYMNHLYRAPLDGSSAAQEITFPGATEDLLISSLFLSPDSQHLLFLGQLSAVSNWGVYSMPITGTGSQAVRLTQTMLQQDEILFKVTPDSKYLVYQHIPNLDYTDQRLYSVPLDGPAADYALLSGPCSRSRRPGAVLRNQPQ